MFEELNGKKLLSEMQGGEMIYLSIPYTHPDPDVRRKRFEIANEVAAYLISYCGEHVYSPISHGHAIFDGRCTASCPGEKYWPEFEAKIMPICTEMYVICVSGWKTSAGVKREIELAKALGIPVRYWEVLETNINRRNSLKCTPTNP